MRIKQGDQTLHSEIDDNKHRFKKLQDKLLDKQAKIWEHEERLYELRNSNGQYKLLKDEFMDQYSTHQHLVNMQLTEI